MGDYLSITEAADAVTQQTGSPVKPRDISKLLYDRELHSGYCPKIGTRHVIAREYLPQLISILRRKGWVRHLEPTV